MKYRSGFVSNSSSSSFICEVCDAHEAGYGSASEFGFCYCENEHELCFSCLLGNFEEIKEPEDDKAWEEWNKRFGYYGPETQTEDKCPVCQFVEPSNQDLSIYLLKKYGVTKEEVFQVIKNFNKRRKKLKDSEYIQHVCKKFNIDVHSLLLELKKEFGTYKNFRKFLQEE
jgi:hypothetical protein